MINNNYFIPNTNSASSQVTTTTKSSSLEKEISVRQIQETPPPFTPINQWTIKWIKDLKKPNIQWMNWVNSQETILKINRPYTNIELMLGMVGMVQTEINSKNYFFNLNLGGVTYLGSVLNVCTASLNSVPASYRDQSLQELKSLISFTALELLNGISHHYFFKTNEWQEGQNALKHSETPTAKQTTEKLKKIVEKLPCYLFFLRTIVIARDSSLEQNKRPFLKIGPSGRAFGQKEKTKESWPNLQEEWIKSFPTVQARVLELEFPSYIHTIFAKIGLNFYHFSYENGIPSFFDKKVLKNCNRFTSIIFSILTQKDPVEREKELSILKKNFPNALSKHKWDKIFNLTKKQEITLKEIKFIIRERFSPTQKVEMFLSSLCCGETKIAVDACRELSELSIETKEALPSTLGARLHFSAFKVQETFKKEFLEICDKCRDSWILFEALYWSLRKSHLDLKVIEHLDSANLESTSLAVESLPQVFSTQINLSVPTATSTSTKPLTQPKRRTDPRPPCRLSEM